MSLEKINKIKDDLNNYYVNREGTIKMILLAIYARKNAFLIGEPGLAKTDILKAFSLSVKDFNFFEYQMSFSTKLEDLLSVNNNGGIGIDNCHIALIDEFFKGNPSVLNSLLAILNEKIIYVPERKTIPLLTVFATSNEKPDATEGTSMLALYDRFLLRQEVMPLREEEDFKKLMKINKPYEPPADNLLTLDELERDYKDIQEFNLPDGIIDILFLIKKEILIRQVHASDRRFRDLVSILKASAFFRGDSEIKKEDIYSIKSSLWTYSSDIKSVDILINRVLQTA
ncbi:MAG: MoxR family ATPase [Deltaproteobacteria bacterium]|jgi:MoxR-like ATPase|nr:MoxR family ATPase [Deltaproteobacteria bacterium]MDA8304015.1 MoxR family ATPase [Deltaproteobacteria bacterium]